PKWVDGTAVGGCSFMIHVRHAAAALESGLCRTVLITHGESGRSGIARSRPAISPGSLAGQFELPYGPMGPPTLFTIPVLRYMKTYGTTEEQLAMVAVVQREWAAKNPRATFKDPVTVKDVLASRMIAYPFRLLLCCLVTDGGGALILTRADRAKDFPQKPVYLLGTGESVETPMVSQMEDFTSSRAFRVAGPTAFAEAGITHNDVDHLMIYDAPCSLPGAGFAHLPIYGLEDLGFVPRGDAGAFIAERNTTSAANCRSTPTAAASPTCIPACTACMPCRRACDRCAASPRRRCPAPSSRCATASAGCLPPPARSSWRTRVRRRDHSLTREAHSDEPIGSTPCAVPHCAGGVRGGGAAVLPGRVAGVRPRRHRGRGEQGLRADRRQPGGALSQPACRRRGAPDPNVRRGAQQ